MMALFDQLMDNCSGHGIKEVVIGMPHRGRLNLLLGLLQFSNETFFHKVCDACTTCFCMGTFFTTCDFALGKLSGQQDMHSLTVKGIYN